MLATKNSGESWGSGKGASKNLKKASLPPRKLLREKKGTLRRKNSPLPKKKDYS